jgi:hypothetical protein
MARAMFKALISKTIEAPNRPHQINRSIAKHIL